VEQLGPFGADAVDLHPLAVAVVAVRDEVVLADGGRAAEAARPSHLPGPRLDALADAGDEVRLAPVHPPQHGRPGAPAAQLPQLPAGGGVEAGQAAVAGVEDEDALADVWRAVDDVEVEAAALGDGSR